MGRLDVDAALVRKLAELLDETGLSEIEFRQSNIEGDLVGWIQQARGRHAGIVINAGGYTHTSVAILDALLALEVPVVEVHLSNLYRREEFRQKSLTARAAVGVISGLGKWSYLLAVQYLADSTKG